MSQVDDDIGKIVIWKNEVTDPVTQLPIIVFSDTGWNRQQATGVVYLFAVIVYRNFADQGLDRAVDIKKMGK